MAVKFLNRNVFQRIFGLPATPKPLDPDCWSFSDGRITIDLKRATELKKPGGALRLEGGGLPMRVLVVHGENRAFYAFQNRCTHLGHRRLDPVPGTGTVQCCSVNKSTYTYDGNKIYGPTSAPIGTFKVELDAERLIVALG
jgi:nitrite reductase/ring-hydroxylating ferredoxin subunit